MNKRLKEEVLKLFGIESDESELAGLVILQAIFLAFRISLPYCSLCDLS